MKFDLASRVDRRSRRPIVLRPIQPTQTHADALATIYFRVVRLWRDGAPHIVAAYEKTLSEIRLDTADDLRSAIDAIGNELQRIVMMLTPDLRDWALRVEQVHRGKWIRNILSATQIDLSTVLGPDDVAETVAEVVEWNVGLIRDVSEEQRRRITNSVFAGIQQRRPVRDVAKEIREAAGMARLRSMRVASDQTVKLGERLNQARQQQAGLTHFLWRHSGKLHPREHHQARDGKTYPWEKSGIPADDMPGVPPFCGCTAVGVVTFDS